MAFAFLPKQASLKKRKVIKFQTFPVGKRGRHIIIKKFSRYLSINLWNFWNKSPLSQKSFKSLLLFSLSFSLSLFHRPWFNHLWVYWGDIYWSCKERELNGSGVFVLWVTVLYTNSDNRVAGIVCRINVRAYPRTHVSQPCRARSSCQIRNPHWP